MSTEAITAAGSTFSLCITATAPADQAAYEALSYTEVANVVTGSTLGGTINNTTFEPLTGEVTQNIAGNKTIDPLTLQLAYASSDAGQSIIKSLVKVGDANYKACVALKFELSTGQVFYNYGFCTQYAPNVSAANDMVEAGVTFLLNSDYLEV